MPNRHGNGAKPSVNTRPQPGEVWLADLGLAEKTRPVLVLYYPGEQDGRALAIVAPLTSQVRGQRGEVDIGHPKWLPKPSAVNLQGLASFDRHKFIRCFGRLTPEQLERVKAALRDLLAL